VKVSLSVREAPSFGNENHDVHLVEVDDDAGDLLCRMFIQPTERGCHVQVDARPAPEDPGSGASFRVASTDDLILVGVESRAVESWGTQ